VKLITPSGGRVEIYPGTLLNNGKREGGGVVQPPLVAESKR